MPMSNQSPATRMSLIYITTGSIIVIWTVVWLLYLMNNPHSSSGIYYVVFGFMATGAVIAAIGLGIGSIGRSAKQAEHPPVVPAPPPPPSTPQVVAPAAGAVPPATPQMPPPAAVPIPPAAPAGAAYQSPTVSIPARQ